MSLRRIVLQVSVWLVLCLLTWDVMAQELETQPSMAPVASYDYLIAYANPLSMEQATQALQEFNAGEARILLLAPAMDLVLSPDFGEGNAKPVLVTRKPMDEAVQVENDRFLSVVNDSSGRAVGQLQRLRRETRASRWSVGLIEKYRLLEDPRLDLTLFQDDPLDVLFAGSADVLLGQPQGKHPFGRSMVMSPPNDGEKLLHLFSVSDSGIAPYVLPSTEVTPSAGEAGVAEEGGTTP